jgi:alpha-mannosidase
LLDKELGQELIDSDAPHGFGQMIIRDCGTGEEELSRTLGASLAQVGPVYATIKLKKEASCCPRVTEEITLYHTIKRVDLSARILRDSTPTKEVFFAFPFQVEEPRFHFEAPNAVIEPIQDQLPGSNTDYYAVQHWAHVGNKDWGVAWSAVDAPMAEFGGLWPGYVSSAHHQARGPGYGHTFLQPGELTQGHIYSLVSYNNFNTNFVNVHPCEYLVRYSFRAHAGGWREARVRQFGWDVANPPLAVWMDGSRKGGSLPTSASFCEVDAANVMVLTFKKAEDGQGHILRLLETEGTETVATVNLPFLEFRQVSETNLVEEDQRELPGARHSLTVAIKPYALTTLRLQ